MNIKLLKKLIEFQKKYDSDWVYFKGESFSKDYLKGVDDSFKFKERRKHK